MKFRHLLITNFQYPADFAFLDERLELFNKLTIPSVRNQTYKNFTWIIIVNNITLSISIPDDLGMKYLKISNEDFQKFLLKQTSDYLITTRLTNGDMIHPKFIEEIQGKAEPATGGYLIDFNFLNYDIQTKKIFKNRISEDPKTLSPFISLVEPLVKKRVPATIHRRAYKNLNKFKTMTKKINKFYAVQIVHDYIDVVSNNPYEDPITGVDKEVNSVGRFFNKYVNKLK